MRHKRTDLRPAKYIISRTNLAEARVFKKQAGTGYKEGCFHLWGQQSYYEDKIHKIDTFGII